MEVQGRPGVWGRRTGGGPQTYQPSGPTSPETLRPGPSPVHLLDPEGVPRARHGRTTPSRRKFAHPRCQESRSVPTAKRWRGRRGPGDGHGRNVGETNPVPQRRNGRKNGSGEKKGRGTCKPQSRGSDTRGTPVRELFTLDDDGGDGRRTRRRADRVALENGRGKSLS